MQGGRIRAMHPERAMCADTRVARTVADDRDVDWTIGHGTDVPQRSRSSVTEHSGLAACQQGGHRARTQVGLVSSPQVHATVQRT